MAEPEDFKEVLKYSLGGSVALYGSIGLIGYLAFGSQVRDIILFNFSMENPIFVFIQISYCIAILLSYPLQMFPIVNIIELDLLARIQKKHGYSRFSNQDNNNNNNINNNVNSAAGQKRAVSADIHPSSEVSRVSAHSIEEVPEDLPRPSADDDKHSDEDEIQKDFIFQSNILRVSSLLIVVLVATLFKHISTFLNLIGSLSGCFFCFVLPVLTYEKCMPHAPKKVIQLHWGLMAMGIFFAVIGTYSSLNQLFN